jgi:hypothetical protein
MNDETTQKKGSISYRWCSKHGFTFGSFLVRFPVWHQLLIDLHDGGGVGKALAGVPYARLQATSRQIFSLYPTIPEDAVLVPFEE